MSGPLRVGVGGPVGSGKTALVDALCKRLREHFRIAAITNDIYTQEDAQFLVRSGALPASLSYLEERVIGPSLGADSIRAGVLSRSQPNPTSDFRSRNGKSMALCYPLD